MGPLVCLRHIPHDDVGVGEEVAREAGVELRYAGPLDEPPPAVTDIGGLVILGGEMNVDEIAAYPHLASERALVRAAVDRGVPVLGICLGAQMLARALGAEVCRLPARETGFTPVDPTPALDGDPLFGAFQPGERVFQSHQDAFALPHGSDLLLKGRVVDNQAFRFGDHAWGMQFHLEVSEAKFERWLARNVGRVRDWGGDADDIRRTAADHLPQQIARFRQVFDAFVRLAT
jgi:GMP synthase (glutamine-hydrolysing)